MRMTNRNFVTLIVAIFCIFLALMFLTGNRTQRNRYSTKAVPVSANQSDRTLENRNKHIMVASQPDEPPGPEMVKIGGHWRPKTDVDHLLNPQTTEFTDENRELRLNIGATPFLAPDENEHVSSVAEAIRTKRNPERLTIFQRGQPFDLATFQEAPEEYLNTIEPGRVFQPAEPGLKVKPLRRKGVGFTRVLQGETAILRVQAEPHAPVSFHSSKLGQFSSGLNSITVQADKNGIAEARFTASGGTYQDVEILAASPVNSGQVEFLVYVELVDRFQEIDP